MTDGPTASGPPMYESMPAFLEENKNWKTEEPRAAIVLTEVLPEQHESLPESSLPPQQPISHPSSPPPELLPAHMVYQRADLQPYMPLGFQRVAIQGRDQMVRAVINCSLALHEDIVIVTIEDLP